MKQKLKIVVLLFFFLFTGIPVQAATCDYKTLAELNKNASRITAAYEVKNGNNKESFDITVHNIIEDLYVTVIPTSRTVENLESFQISNDMTTNGSYTFHVDNISDIIEYQFIVRTTKENCTDDIYKFNLIKPKKNELFTSYICKYSEVVDYYYCQEWIETDFSLTNEEVIEKIKEEKKRNEAKTTTTKCALCEYEEKRLKDAEKVKTIKMYLLIVVGLLTIIDSLFMIVFIIRARRIQKWD